MNTPKKIIVACGGTGGHIFPGLVTARELSGRGHDVALWLSGRRDVEAQVTAGYNGRVFHTGAVQPKPRNLPAFTAACFRCLKKMRAENPGVVLAMGSYSSLAPVAAARLCHVPVVLHEANATPGQAVKFLSRFAARIAATFPEAVEDLPAQKVVSTGLPLRTQHLLDAARLPDFPEGVFTVFVTGGSQGAHRVNELASAALALLVKDGVQNLRVIHQTGAADEEAVAAAYRGNGVAARVSAFLQDMGAAYATADLVIARAGAATCMETALCNLPAIFIPLPRRGRNDQSTNARSFARAGAALCLVQDGLTPEKLAAEIRALYENPARLAEMRGRAGTLATPDATARLADLVEATAHPARE